MQSLPVQRPQPLESPWFGPGVGAASGNRPVWNECRVCQVSHQGGRTGSWTPSSQGPVRVAAARAGTAVLEILALRTCRCLEGWLAPLPGALALSSTS